MNKWSLMAVSALAASVVCAEEEAAASTEEKTDPIVAQASVKPAPATGVFTTLPYCFRASGVAEVRRPNSDWTTIEEGKFYPLGSSYRTAKGAKLTIAFGPESKVTISDLAEFSTRPQPLLGGGKTRTIQLQRGTVELALPVNLPEGAFVVTASGFTVKNPAGESRYVFTPTGDGDLASIRCVTGSLGVEGRHFEIPAMRAANEFEIRTSHDFLETFLYGKSGDVTVRLDQGLRTIEKIGDDGLRHGEVTKSSSEWKLSPKTKVMINRAVPALGERMSVHTMAFDAAGELKSEFDYCEGRAEINSGERVVPPKTESDELAKSAAAAEETTVEAVEDEEEEKSEEQESDSNNNNENSNEEEE